MNFSPECPICAHAVWEVICTKNYASADPISDPYTRIRMEVLYNLWFSGNSTVTLESIGCPKCGFVCFRPRPDEDNLREKYAYINQHEESSKEFTAHRSSDSKRAKNLYRYLRGNLKNNSVSILDYGGGNGRLLGEFLKNGHPCSVLDLVDNALPGISYAGDRIESLPEDKKFDLIVCSHVLEHLVNPLKTLELLSERLSEDGYLYIEVPSEIWREAPPKLDPVTHINFFTTDSMRTMVNTAGLQVVSCKYDEFTRPNGLTGIAIKSVLQRAPTASMPTIKYEGLREVRRLLGVGPLGRLMRLVKFPRMLSNLYKSPA